MTHRKLSLLAVTAVLASAVSLPALAGDPDEAACAGKAEGDPCVESDGDAGTCVPDSDTGVLECEDNDNSTGSGQSKSADAASLGGCSAATTAQDPWTAAVLVLGAVAVVTMSRRRREM